MGTTQSTPAVSLSTTTEVIQKDEQQTRETEPAVLPQTTEEPKKDIFERYVEPQGTKIEVQPTEVMESADVVKKTKKRKTKD